MKCLGQSQPSSLPENGLTEVADGSITFDHVDFAYTDEKWRQGPCLVRYQPQHSLG